MYSLPGRTIPARRKFHLYLIRWQTVELINQLLDFLQVDQLVRANQEKLWPTWSLARSCSSAPCNLNYQHLQMAAGKPCCGK
jgi:hypothetical protein